LKHDFREKFIRQNAALSEQGVASARPQRSHQFFGPKETHNKYRHKKSSKAGGLFCFKFHIVLTTGVTP
jgi:hypothetical protein